MHINEGISIIAKERSISCVGVNMQATKVLAVGRTELGKVGCTVSVEKNEGVSQQEKKWPLEMGLLSVKRPRDELHPSTICGSSKKVK